MLQYYIKEEEFYQEDFQKTISFLFEFLGFIDEIEFELEIVEIMGILVENNDMDLSIF